MRTKNPFCTGTDLAVMRAIRAYPGKRVNEMALLIEMSDATFSHSLVNLHRAGHIKRAGTASYRLGYTGRLLLDCAEHIERARKRIERARKPRP